MSPFDDTFLQEIGLGELPDEQKGPFLEHVQMQLQERVGERLTEGMSDEKLAEFSKIIDHDELVINEFLSRFAPNYQEDPIFQRLVQATQAPADDPRLRYEYTAAKWMEVNIPNNRQVVLEVLTELKREIMANRQAILGQ